MECWIIIYFNTCFIVYNLLVHSIDCQCVLPLTNGTWLSSSRGTWTIPENRTEIQNFKASLTPSETIHDLACYSSSGNRYILGTKSSIQILQGIFVNSFTCLEITATSNSPSTYEFYFVTDIDVSTGEPFNSDVNAVCDGAVEETGANTNIIVADGVDIETVKQSFPDVIRGEYIVTITDQNGQTSNLTTMSSCNDTSAFYFTETGNAAQTVSAVGFSDSGILYNLKSFSSDGVTFIYTYNNDTSVDSSSTYIFSCWAVSQVSSTVYATVYPEVCQDGQNSTSVPRGGQILILEASAASTSDDSGLSAVVIAIIVIVCVLVLLAVIIIVVCCIRKKIRQDQSQSQKTTEESNVKPGMKGTKRPKSSNDLDSARLINEQNKAKLAKKLAKKKETRTIAVQASIWTAPIKRTTTALSTEPLRSNSQSSLKFIPYIRKQVVIAKPPVEMNNVTRSKTTLEHNNHNSKHPTVTRAKTTLDKNDGVTKHVPKYLVKKNTVNNPRQKILRQMSVISRHSTDYYANEFERRFPFPNEGNPNEYHNTLDIPDETEGFQDTDVNQPSITAPKDNAQSIKKEREVGFRVENLNHRENTKNSLRSRPSTTDGVLGVKLKNTPGSIRKTYSEGTDHSKSILKFSYNSPYAMSEAQKNYSLQKAAWIRHQISKDLHNKKHIEQMIKLEGERAFDKWVINKRKSISVTRRKYSKTSFKTHKTDSSVTGSSKTDDTVKESSNDAVESIKDGLNTVESVNNISNS